MNNNAQQKKKLSPMKAVQKYFSEKELKNIYKKPKPKLKI